MSNPLSAPTKLPELSRCLSHSDKAEEAARAYFECCQEGETILANFFIDYKGWTTLEYYKKENGIMVLHHLEGQREEIKMEFTYQSTDYGF